MPKSPKEPPAPASGESIQDSLSELFRATVAAILRSISPGEGEAVDPKALTVAISFLKDAGVTAETLDDPKPMSPAGRRKVLNAIGPFEPGAYDDDGDDEKA